MTIAADKALEAVDAEFTIVRPLATVDQALASFREYEALTRALLQPSDYQTFINEQGKQARFIKKRGLRRLAVHYGFHTELVDERLGHKHDPAICARVRFPDVFKDLKDCGCPLQFARYVVKVTAPNGRVVIQPGLCSTNERRKFTRPDHDLATTAYTRAVSRAIADMIGIADPDAEEARETKEISGLSVEERDAIKAAWSTAPHDNREAALAYMRDAGIKGETTADLFRGFAVAADESAVADLLRILRTVEAFNPEEVPL
jgi:hypothetical protein